MKKTIVPGVCAAIAACFFVNCALPSAPSTPSTTTPTTTSNPQNYTKTIDADLVGTWDPLYLATDTLKTQGAFK